MRIIDRFDKYMTYSGLNDNKVTVTCGLSVGLLGKARSGKSDIGKAAIDKILTKYQNLNKVWLLTGEGEMLKNSNGASNLCPTSSTDDSNAVSGKLIPFYDIEAAAGNAYGMNMSPTTKPAALIEIGSVLRDSEVAIRVYGNSMVPNYPAGCIIALKHHTDSFIEPGRVYVVETRDNRYLKRVYYTDDKTALHCISDNNMKHDDGPRKGKLCYPDFEIPFDEIVRLHRVVGVIKRNIM